VAFMVVAFPLFYMMFGAQMAHADNESSYQWGYRDGFDDYSYAIKYGNDFPSSNIADVCKGVPEAVTNQTACTDGYVNGWKDWCMTDMKDCLEAVQSGDFPDEYHQLKPDAGFAHIP
jgi:hypothetical protein